MNVIYYSRTKKPVDYKYVELDKLLRISDVVSVHCSVNPTSKEMINAEKIKLMKDNSILINTSSNLIFKEEEIIPIIKQKNIKIAVDAFEEGKIKEEWFSIPNALLTRHIGYLTYESSEKRNDITIENARKFLEGNPQNVCR